MKTSDVWLKCVLLLLPVFFIGNTIAQNSCSNPDTLVTGGYYTINLPVGTGSAPSGPDYDCLASQNSPTWFFMNICEPGDLEFQITPGGSGTDVDFICWGPITSVSSLSDMCSQVSAQTVSVEDCSFSQSYIETINITGAAAGEFYLVMITNFTDLAGTINIQQSGGTGITCDSIVADSAFCSTDPQHICEVTMNDSATHCKVVWEKTPMLADETYYIYRLNYLSVYELIDSVQAPDSSYYIDYSSVSSASSYRYKISRKDSCGNITPLSQMHQSIHLQASTGTGQVNLSWSEYLGISIPTYYIFRGSDPWNMSVLDSISAVFVSYSDLNTNPAEPYYQIRMVNPNPCNITRSPMPYIVSNVSSSILPSGISSIHGVDLHVYPNPASEMIHFVMEKFTHQKLLVSVTDIVGNDLLEVPLKEGRATLNLNNFSKGMYFYSVHEKGIPVVTGKFVVE